MTLGLYVKINMTAQCGGKLERITWHAYMPENRIDTRLEDESPSLRQELTYKAADGPLCHFSPRSHTSVKQRSPPARSSQRATKRGD